jgi:hypothetical protein
MKRKTFELSQADASLQWHQAASETYMSGSLSGIRLQGLVAKAENAGAVGAADIAKAGKSGDLKKNIARDLNRNMRRNSLWPKFYYAKIPIWDPKLESMTLQSHPFLLPHEWIAKSMFLTGWSSVAANEALHTGIFRHMQKIAQGLGSPVSDFVPLGFHCDGVPFGSQVFYSDSLELFSLNFPCGDIGTRIPFTAVQRTHLVKHETYNAILGVLAWSLKQLAFGVWPETRHDGSNFDMGDAHRTTLQHKYKPAKALLVEIRADWVALKQIFRFPQQNENSGICWMCHATPADIRDCSLSASWRSQRRTVMSFHTELRHAGKSCPMWSVPGVNSSIVIVDWLHCADLGVTADVMGNVLLELLDFFVGADRHVKMRALWSRIRQEYALQQIPQSYQFPNLRLASFFNGKKSPKLKGKAAHVRGLVPVLDSIVQQTLLSDDCHSLTVKSCMMNLAICYSCLLDFSADKLDEASRRMAILYVSLEKEQLQNGVLKRWRVKPKLHLFMELCSFLCLKMHRGNPKFFWTYADESHGGILRGLAKSRGGRASSASSAYRMLTFWVANNDLWQLLD